jgi:hypothetical protein
VETAHGRRDADRSSDIRANANDRTLHGDQGALAAAAAARDELAIVRIVAATEEMVENVADHECLWDVGAAVEDCACVAKQADESAVVRRDAPEVGAVAHRRF